MLTNKLINPARAIAGFLALACIVGLLFFPLRASWSLVYGVLSIAACGLFCVLPRRWLPHMWAAMAVLAVATVCLTVVMAYQDLILINGADHGALVMRGVEVFVLVVMLREALDARVRRTERSV